MDIRIGVTQSARELTLELPDDTDQAKLKAEVELALADDDRVLWLIDKKGRQVAVPSKKIAYVELRRAVSVSHRLWRLTVVAVATLAELVRQNTRLGADDLAHLQRLVGDWGVLADFCFADLLLYGRRGPTDWVVLAQVRPYTGQTLYVTDWVGTVADDTEDTLLEKVFDTGTRTRDRSRDRGAAERQPHAGHSGSARGTGHCGTDPRMERTCWASARRTRTHLPSHLRAIRGDDRGGHVPVSVGLA